MIRFILQKGWVELSAQKFMPRVAAQVSRFNVVSARSTYQDAYPNRPDMVFFFSLFLVLVPSSPSTSSNSSILISYLFNIYLSGRKQPLLNASVRVSQGSLRNTLARRMWMLSPSVIPSVRELLSCLLLISVQKRPRWNPSSSLSDPQLSSWNGSLRWLWTTSTSLCATKALLIWCCRSPHCRHPHPVPRAQHRLHQRLPLPPLPLPPPLLLQPLHLLQAHAAPSLPLLPHTVPQASTTLPTGVCLRRCAESSKSASAWRHRGSSSSVLRHNAAMVHAWLHYDTLCILSRAHSIRETQQASVVLLLHNASLPLLLLHVMEKAITLKQWNNSNHLWIHRHLLHFNLSPFLPPWERAKTPPSWAQNNFISFFSSCSSLSVLFYL